MRLRIAASFALGMAVAGPCAAQAGQAAQPNAVAKIAIRTTDSTVASARAIVDKLQSVGTFKHEELLRLSSAGGAITAEIMPAARRTGQFRCKVEGSTADWVMTFSEVAVARSPIQSLSVLRYDFDQLEKGGIWATTAHIRSSLLSSIDGRAGSGTDYGRVSLSQSGGTWRLTVYGRKLTPDGRTFSLQGSNLHDLRARGPRQFRQYVIPLLKSIGGQDPFVAAPGDVYRAFEQLPADPQVIQQVRQVLPTLDSPLPAEREEGSRKLMQLGAKGVLAALRIDRAPLSPEQRGRLDTFIARHEDRQFATAQEARSNAMFLIDCLEFDDPAVRKLASAELARLWGRAVDLDLDAPPAKRAEQADALREAALKTGISAATRPATRPAAGRAHFIPQPAVSE